MEIGAEAAGMTGGFFLDISNVWLEELLGSDISACLFCFLRKNPLQAQGLIQLT